MARNWTPRIARATIAAALLVLLAGPAIRFGVLPWPAGLGMFVIGALLAGIGGIFCLVMQLRRLGGALAAVAAAAGLAGLLVPVAIVAGAGAKPAIHDISTDTIAPPQFVAVTGELRGAGSNPLAYEPRLAALQAKAYPDLKPLTVAAPPPATFDRALAAARASGWTIVAADAAAGRIEATDTVPWWGFKDDVVIRIVAADAGSRVDVRSVSRVGVGDLGVNARRIGDYLAKLGG